MPSALDCPFQASALSGGSHDEQEEFRTHELRHRQPQQGRREKGNTSPGSHVSQLADPVGAEPLGLGQIGKQACLSDHRCEAKVTLPVDQAIQTPCRCVEHRPEDPDERGTCRIAAAADRSYVGTST